MEPDGTSARDELERAILGEDPVFNALEVAEQTGVTVEELRRLWRALGFPEHGLEVAFTAAVAVPMSTLAVRSDPKKAASAHTATRRGTIRPSRRFGCAGMSAPAPESTGRPGHAA